MTLVLASLTGPWPSTLELAARGVGAWLAVLALRLWDDLKDRQEDAKNHPERVLTQIGSARPYFLAVAVLLGIAGLLVVLGGGIAWGFFVLLGALWVFYRTVGHETRLQAGTLRAERDFVVLLKYPLLVVVLGGTDVSVAALALIFAAVCTDEVLQGSRPQSAGILVASAALVGSASLMLVTSDALTAARALHMAMIAGMAALALQCIFGKPRKTLTRGGLLAMTFGTLLCSNPKIAELLHAY